MNLMEVERVEDKKLSKKQQTELLRQALQQGFEQHLREHFLDVVEAVVAEAKNGNMKAAQMIMDRVVPTIAVEKGMDQEKNSIRAVNIVIGTVNNEPLEIQPAEVLELDD